MSAAQRLADSISRADAALSASVADWSGRYEAETSRLSAEAAAALAGLEAKWSARHEGALAALSTDRAASEAALAARIRALEGEGGELRAAVDGLEKAKAGLEAALQGTQKVRVRGVDWLAGWGFIAFRRRE